MSDTKTNYEFLQSMQGAEVGVSEWILIDYGDLLVHVMHPKAREFFSLEKLWDESINPEVHSN